MTDKRKYSFFPKTLSECIEPTVRPVLKTQGLAGSRILTQWDNIVGESLARHTLPERLTFPKGKTIDGMLTISVENGFATELQHMQPVILERLAAYFGYKAVSRITIAHTWQMPPEPIVPQVKRATVPVSLDAVDAVEDPELKAALSSFAKSLSGK